MQIAITRISDGFVLGEAVVAIKTKERLERLLVDEGCLSGNRMEIGYPVGRDGDFYLVQLPQETMSGYWRVWVAIADVGAPPP